MWPLLWAVGTAVLTKRESNLLMESLHRISEDLHTVVGLLDKHLPTLIASDVPGPDYHRSARDSEEYKNELAKARKLAEKMHQKSIEMGVEPESDQTKKGEREKTDDEEGVLDSPFSPSFLEKWEVIRAFLDYGPVRYFYLFALFCIDIVIWTSLQVFLDTIGKMKKKKKKSRTTSRSRSTTPIPNEKPKARGRKLAILTQEDTLARLLEEYAGKVLISFGVAVVCRLPAWFIHDGLVLQILDNLVITLRGLAVVTFFIQDDVSG